MLLNAKIVISPMFLSITGYFNPKYLIETAVLAMFL